MDSTFDLEALKKPNFDVNVWLSRTTASFPDNGNHEETVKKLSSQVQGEITKTKECIDALTTQMIQHLPRAARDLEVTQKEMTRLQEDMSNGLNEAENVQMKTTTSMTTLEKLDNIKTRLVSTSCALQEADKWTSLSKEIEQFLDSGDVNKAYECIVGMEKSISVLNEAQAEERRLILEEMKNRLEALATKHLILAFDTNNAENAKYFFSMFTNMERTQRFVKYFQDAEKLKFSQDWRHLVEMLPFKDAIVKFYDNIIDHMHAKMQWCKIIFSDDPNVNPVNVLVELYGDSIRSLDPSLQFCFDSEAKKVPFIDVLLSFNQTSHRFVNNLHQYVEAQGTIHGMEVNKTNVKNLLKTVFSPFLSLYSKYSKFHENQIFNKLQASSVLSHQASAEGAPSLQERVENSKRLLPEMILVIKECEEKVIQFNRGLGYLHFGKGVNNGLERFVDWNRDVFKILERSILHPEAHRNLLENALGFTEACGEVLLQVTKLDVFLTANGIRIMEKFVNIPSSDVWEMLNEHCLDSNHLNEINAFMQKKESILRNSIHQMKKLCTDATQLLLRVTAEPVEQQLKKNFSLVDCTLKEAIPSEYITQIGEYLMLLPQNLDPFITSENSSILYSFDHTLSDDGRSPVDYILSNLAGSICDTYSSRILKVTFLTDGQAKQLAQDIDYLGSVLEDLGLRLSTDVSDIGKLMKNYGNLSDPAIYEKVSPKVISAVRKMKVKPVS